MKILITGSEGLIGSSLSIALSRLGITVLGFDNKLEPHHLCYGDILNYEQVTEAINDVDGVIHLAAVSRVVFGEKNPKSRSQLDQFRNHEPGSTQTLRIPKKRKAGTP